MKKVLALFVCFGFIFSASECVSAQQKLIKKSPADTTRMKIKAPQKQIQKQKIKETKQIDQKEFRRFIPEPVLLMKEKEIDTLQKKNK